MSYVHESLLHDCTFVEKIGDKSPQFFYNLVYVSDYEGFFRNA